jgi:hypothetical protein
LAPIKLTSHAKKAISVLEALFEHSPCDDTNKSKEGHSVLREFILNNLDIPLKVTLL